MNRVCNISREDLERRVLAGETLGHIADELGVAKATVHSRAVGFGIEANPSGARRVLPAAEVLVAAIAAGQLLRQVGEAYGVTGEAVGDAIRRAGYRRVGKEYKKDQAA